MQRNSTHPLGCGCRGSLACGGRSGRWQVPAHPPCCQPGPGGHGSQAHLMGEGGRKGGREGGREGVREERREGGREERREGGREERREGGDTCTCTYMYIHIGPQHKIYTLNRIARLSTVNNTRVHLYRCRSRSVKFGLAVEFCWPPSRTIALHSGPTGTSGYTRTRCYHVILMLFVIITYVAMSTHVHVRTHQCTLALLDTCTSTNGKYSRIQPGCVRNATAQDYQVPNHLCTYHVDPLVSS